MSEEPDRDRVPRKDIPDSLQQRANRLLKRYEHLRHEDRQKRVIKEIERMELSDAERRELLRRID